MSDETTKSPETVECQTSALVRSDKKGRTITCNRGLGSITLPTRITSSLPAKLGRYKNYDSKWLILSVSLDGNLDVGHTALVYQSEVDLEADTCGFTLQWVSDITVSLFTNNKRQLKLLTATLTPSNLREWGEYLAARRNPSAVRLGNNILQLWVAL